MRIGHRIVLSGALTLVTLWGGTVACAPHWGKTVIIRNETDIDVIVSYPVAATLSLEAMDPETRYGPNPKIEQVRLSRGGQRGTFLEYIPPVRPEGTQHYVFKAAEAADSQAPLKQIFCRIYSWEELRNSDWAVVIVRNIPPTPYDETRALSCP